MKMPRLLVSRSSNQAANCPRVWEFRLSAVLMLLLLNAVAGLGQTFGPPTVFPTQPYVNGIRTADFNHDGILDIVINNVVNNMPVQNV